IWPLVVINSIENVIKLVMSCLIHPLVGEAAEGVVESLDDIELQTAHKDVYKEALYFSSIRSDRKMGFTVANITRFSTTLLTLVSNELIVCKCHRIFRFFPGIDCDSVLCVRSDSIFP